MSCTFRAAACALLAALLPAPSAFAQEAAGELRAPALSERAFILLFDYPVGGLRQQEEVRAAAESWISRELLPADLVAVTSTYGSELLLEQDFTADRQALTEAVADAIRGRSRASVPAPPGTPSLLAHLPQGDELVRRAANFYGILQVLAEASDGFPGRKSLLVFSKGFGRNCLAAEVAQVVPEAPERGFAEPLPAVAGSPLLEKYLADRELYEPTLAALQSHRVALYPVDLATDVRETYPLAGVMSQLAGATGGRYLYPAFDLPRLFARVLEDDPRERPAAREPESRVAGSGQGGERAATKAREE